MGLFSKRGSKDKLSDVAVGETGAPPPSEDVLMAPNKVICTVGEQYKWLLQEALKDTASNLLIVEQETELPTSLQTDDIPPETPSRRRKKKSSSFCPLRLEVQDSNDELLLAVHGISEAFDGIEDKDELVRTMQRCRCDHLEISPPSRLVNWDVTKEECMNVVGKEMPTLLGSKNQEGVAVLKEPMGSRGTGIFFVRSAEEIHTIIEEHRKRAVEDPNFLPEIIAMKGRIPSWVLQAEIRPCLLIRDRRKFHIRTYVVGMEKLHTDELLETYVYNRHEVRIALEPVPEDDGDRRDRAAHIIDGAYTMQDGRALLDEVPELEGLPQKIELFVSQIFARHLIKDLSRRVGISTATPAQKFVLAGLDIMVTEDKRLYLLEVNLNPSVPQQGTLKESFEQHLVGFMGDLVNLVTGKPTKNFISSHNILAQKGSGAPSV